MEPRFQHLVERYPMLGRQRNRGHLQLAAHGPALILKLI
jgi:hypothetical protein